MLIKSFVSNLSDIYSEHQIVNWWNQYKYNIFGIFDCKFQNSRPKCGRDSVWHKMHKPQTENMMLTRIPRIVYYCLSSSVFALYQRHHVTSSDSFFSLETLRMFCLLAILKFYALRLAVVQTSYFLLVMNKHLFLRLNQFMQPCSHAYMKFVARLLRLMMKNCWVGHRLVW